MKILGLKSIVIGMKDSLEGLDCKCELSEERISKLEDRAIEITQAKEQRA